MSSKKSSLLAILAPASVCSLATAQQKVCFSVHAGPATGLNNLNQPSDLRGEVNGHTVTIKPGTGTTAAGASAAHEAAFQAAGYTAERTNATEFCVTRAATRCGRRPLASRRCRSAARS
jgi:hypothetical protein